MARYRKTWRDGKGARRRVPQGKKLHVRRSLHRALRRFVSTRDESKCRMCGKPGDPSGIHDGGLPYGGFHIDHVMSIGNGGSHHPDNLQLLCESCNCRKGATVDKTAKARRGRRT